MDRCSSIQLANNEDGTSQNCKVNNLPNIADKVSSIRYLSHISFPFGGKSCAALVQPALHLSPQTVQINGLKEIYLKLSESVGANSRAIPHDLLPDPLFSGVTCRLPLVGVRGSHALNDNV